MAIAHADPTDPGATAWLLGDCAAEADDVYLATLACDPLNRVMRTATSWLWSYQG